MSDEDLISALAENDAAARENLIGQITQRAAHYQQNGQHWKGIALLQRAREIAGPAPEISRALALSLGGKAERVLQLAEIMRVRPDEVLEEGDLLEAIKVDPDLPDPYWDLAVVKARFHADYDSAKSYLKDAMARGYWHPMIGPLQRMIDNKPPLTPDTDESRLRRLLLRLAVHSAGPASGTLLIDEESEESGDGTPMVLQTFGDYVREANAIDAKGAISEEDYLAILENSRDLGEDAFEYVADVLRHAGESSARKILRDRATELQLGVIHKMAIHHFGMRSEDPHWVKKSLNAARRGLKIIESSHASIPPDLHADLLVAKGQALYYLQEPDYIEAIRSYHNALFFKREAENTGDVQKLKSLLRKQIEYRAMRIRASEYMGGFREAMDVLDACIDVVDDLDDPTFAAHSRLQFATGKRRTGQYADAEQLLMRVLECSPTPNITWEARFELASVYSETSRPAQAAEIHKKLFDEPGMDENNIGVLWSNYANDLMLLGDLDGARTALENAWNLLPPDEKEKTGEKIPTEGFRIQTMLADIAFKQGRLPEALSHLEHGDKLNPTPLGPGGLYHGEIKARILLGQSRADEATKALDRALHNFRFILGSGPSLPVWESLLQKWSHLDAMSVRAHLARRTREGTDDALIRAESAKGRLTAWVERMIAPKGAEWALSLKRQEESLAAARRWLAAKPGRLAVSLFGSRDGLGVFSVNHGGEVRGVWLDDFNYDLVRSDLYEPWRRLVDRAINGADSDDLLLGASQTNYMLDLAGAWLARALPDLSAGGTDLVVIPHRLFRNLPLMHARLPSGHRLSDIFETIVISPSLADMARNTKQYADGAQEREVNALADADGSLPFARCEALLAQSGSNTRTGSEVDPDAIAGAFGHPGILLLSLHGDFDETNPFQSQIYAAGGAFPLYKLVLGMTPVKSRIVVLGVCEAGRSRQTISDEPLGFPALLLQGGVGAVIAPAWRVDDFASFLFITRLFDSVNLGADIFRTVRDSARWLRELTAQAAIEKTDELAGKILTLGDRGKIAMETLKPRLDAQKQWLASLAPDDKPFRSPLDWAAFQITGLPASA